MPRPRPRKHALDPSDAPETTASSLSVLTSYRERRVRDSSDVVRRGEAVLKERGALKRMGDEGAYVFHHSTTAGSLMTHE